MSRPSLVLFSSAVLAMSVVLATAAVGQPPPPEPDDAYVREIEQWRKERRENLLVPDGWLTLIGLHWLEPGEVYSTGSADTRAIVLPPSVPAEIGTFQVRGEPGARQVLFTARPGVEVTAKSAGADAETPAEPVQRELLRSDADGDPTLLRIGSVTIQVIDREERLALRIKDSQSPARRDFQEIDTFPIAPAWRIEARFEPYDPPRRIAVPNVIGYTSDSESPGALVFEIEGKTRRLDVLPSGDEYFVIFGDRTNGGETYGGGRFLYTPVADADGRVVVDFNKAYNPPCVFTPYATCPLPPLQNKLKIEVRAGEKTYRGGAHHH